MRSGRDDRGLDSPWQREADVMQSVQLFRGATEQIALGWRFMIGGTAAWKAARMRRHGAILRVPTGPGFRDAAKEQIEKPA